MIQYRSVQVLNSLDILWSSFDLIHYRSEQVLIKVIVHVLEQVCPDLVQIRAGTELVGHVVEQAFPSVQLRTGYTMG